jgi:hypothetical protein
MVVATGTAARLNSTEKMLLKQKLHWAVRQSLSSPTKQLTTLKEGDKTRLQST